jgi:hypothetical protein
MKLTRDIPCLICQRHNNNTAHTATHSYYARDIQWLPTSLLVAPRSLNDEPRPLCANNNPVPPVLPPIDYGIPPMIAEPGRRRRKCARLQPLPPRLPQDAAHWSRKLHSDAQKPHFRPHSLQNADGAQDQKLKKSRESLSSRRNQRLAYHRHRRYGVRLLRFFRLRRTKHHWPAGCQYLHKPNMRPRP